MILKILSISREAVSALLKTVAPGTDNEPMEGCNSLNFSCIAGVYIPTPFTTEYESFS